MELQQTLTVRKNEQMTAKQVALLLARKTDFELKREFPVFWELLAIKSKSWKSVDDEFEY
ncbi:MAG: hypothetical protein Q7R70_06440 [Candidatus Diapherotrites archaeon]|nr:hypothetical protein [Candidatus Diapherotrites archaeon]